MQLGAPELVFFFLFWAAALMAVIWPAARVLKRVGMSPYLAILAVVPIANLGLLWHVAYADWPAVTERVQNRP